MLNKKKDREIQELRRVVMKMTMNDIATVGLVKRANTAIEELRQENADLKVIAKYNQFDYECMIRELKG